MKKTLALRAERLTELTTAELDSVVGASGATCTDITSIDINRCLTLLC